MRVAVLSLWLVFAPGRGWATVVEVPRLDLDVGTGRLAAAPGLGVSPSLANPLSPALMLSAPAAALTLAAPAPALTLAAPAPALTPAAPAPAPAQAQAQAPSPNAFDIVLDMDATIIGKVPEGESAKGLPLQDSESITVTYTTFKGDQKTSTYLIRKGFKDFIRRARQDPNVRGIHLLSGSNQLRLNSIASAVEIDGKPLSAWVDTMIGGEFLMAYSPNDAPNASRAPLKDLSLYDLKGLRAIDAALRQGDIQGALSLPRQGATSGGGFLKDNRFLVIDDTPGMVRGGELTQVQGLIPFKGAAKVIGPDVEEKTRKKMMDMRDALWEHQNSEFGRLSGMLEHGLVPGSAEWQAQEQSDFERRWRAAGKNPKN